MSFYADQSGIISIDEMDQPTDVTDLFLIGLLSCSLNTVHKKL